jgi:hypothetical protein
LAGEGGRCALLVLAAVLSAASCAKPTPADLVGRWALTDGSRQYLPDNLCTAAGQVDLVADGTFTAAGLPDMRIESSGRIISTTDGRGTWKILTLGVRRWPRFRAANFDIDLVGADVVLTDPDSGQRLEFARRP